MVKRYRKNFKKKVYRKKRMGYSKTGWNVYSKTDRAGVAPALGPVVRSQAFGAPSVGIQTGRLPFANMGYYRLPYTDSFAITADGDTGLSAITYAYNLCSVYDPNTSIGLGQGQPLQYDLIKNAFERYWCRAAKVTITFSNASQSGGLCGFRIRNSTNVGATTDGRTIAEIKEMDLTRSKWINTQGENVRTFKFFIRPWQIMGVTKAQYNNLEYSAQTNASPTAYVVLEPFFLHTVSGQTNTIRCTVNIKYYVQMTNRQTILDA